MQAFNFRSCQQVICESGATHRLGNICRDLHVGSVLLVTDPAIAELELHNSATANLTDAGIETHVFSDVEADPPESIVLSALALARSRRVDAIIGFGGGSSMDVAKLVAFLAHPNCTQSLSDIYGVDQTKGTRLPLIQVPTTAGTGSEVTQVAIVTTGETTKMGAISPLFLPDIAILDASLTQGLPPSVTAATGVDAMVHAIEAYTSKKKKNPLSDMLAKEALQQLAGNIHTAVHHGTEIAAREAMLLGAMLAGQAFANAPVAAVHALAYPLGGHFHIPHGLSNALVLPHVMRFNLPDAASNYAQLAPIIFPNYAFTGDDPAVATHLVDQIETLIDDLHLPSRLRDLDIPEAMLPMLAEDAMLQTRLLVNNPRDMKREDALAIYQAAF